MSLTSDQIVNSLIAYYKSQGIDLVYVLGDPVFQAMKLDQKIEAIKNNAQILAEGSKISRFGKADAGNILSSAARGATIGLFTVPLAAATFLPRASFSNTKARLGAMAVGGAMGAIAGGISGAMSGALNNEQERAARNRLVDQIHRTGKDNSYQNAIAVLSKSRSFIGSPDPKLKDTILRTIADRVDRHIENTALNENAKGVYQGSYYLLSPESIPDYPRTPA